MKKIISIVAPMYNEEKLVHEYCEETKSVMRKIQKKYDYEIILINDGSTDNTYKEMLFEQKRNIEHISVVCLSRNFGLEGAVKAGLQKANGDAVIVMDADLQDPPALLPKMINKWENGADVVVCSRIKRSNDHLLKKLTAACYYKVLDSLSGKLKLEKSAANFRLLSKKALEVLLSMDEVNSVFRVMVPYVGMKTDVIEYDRDKRFAGKTKYHLKNMIPYALASITSISVEPLRKIFWIIPINFLIIVFSILGMMVSVDIWRAMWGIILAFSVFFGLLFIAIFIIAEYIAQIMLEVKGRPTSIISEYFPRHMSQDESDITMV